MEIAVAKNQEVRQLLETVARNKQFDLESIEHALRNAVLAAGASILSDLLEGIGSGRQQKPVLCTCGATMVSLGRKNKPLLTILGEASFSRSLFQCALCGATRFPGDELLDVVDTTRSPALRRMMSRAGSRATFKESRADLEVYAGIRLSAKDVERVAERTGEAMEAWAASERNALFQGQEPVPSPEAVPIMYVCMDGTGVPMTKEELQGRPGKQDDGSAKTREAKLGCVFTQTTTDQEGYAIREPNSTSFTGAIETAELFGPRIYAEAVRRGLLQAKKIVVIADGAEWIRNLAETHFPNAIQILDLFHAREHVADLSKLLFAPDELQQRRYRNKWWELLDKGMVESIASEASTSLLSLKTETREKAEKEIAYLMKNKERMRYDAFRAQGLFVGSGVMEAGCKTIVGQRLKQSGMEWSVRGANAIIALRCMFLSNRTEDFYADNAG